MPEQEKTSVIPLQHIDFHSEIKGSFARVACTQVFLNSVEKPVEAVYVFPMPDDASVTECVMRIGEKKIVADIKKREEARKEYDAAVQAGHHAALLEQERPNIFTINVGGIEPGQEISVRIAYVQRIPWQGGGGRFRIPLVVAPQFIPGVPVAEKKGKGWSPDTTEVPDASRITPPVAEEGVLYDASIIVTCAPGFKCKIQSPSHPAIIGERTIGERDAVELKAEKIKTDQDFVLVYQSLSKIPQVALHAGGLGSESFLLASIIPPGEAPRVPSDIVFVLDCSGSMEGAKIEGLKVIVKKVVRKLRDENIGHRVGIVPFDHEPWPAHPISEISEATEKFIDALEARGGTQLGYALEAAEKLFTDPRQPRVIFMVTDGDTEAGKDWKGKDVRLIGLGIDTAVNDARINELTRRNNGTAEFVFPGEEHDAVASRVAGYLSGPVLRNIKVKSDGDVVGLSDVFEGRPASISIRFKGGVSPHVRLSGWNPEGREGVWEFDAVGARDCAFAPQIWARDFIRENPTEKDAQVEASLNYKVICQHTSFVAVSEKEVPGQAPERVEIPVNLPAGWNYGAVFGAVAKGFGVAARGLGSPMMRGSLGGDMSFGALSCSSVDEAADFAEVGEVSDETLLDSDLLEMEVAGADVGDEGGTLSSPEPVSASGFQLDAKDFGERIIAIFIAVISGKRAEAEKALRQLERELQPKVFERLDEKTREMICYFAIRIDSCGLATKLASIAPPKKIVGDEALAWASLIRKERGQKAVPVKVAYKDGNDVGSYIAWKFGIAPRPTSGKWSQVP